jgi:phosphopantetheine adenylyltransferase
MSRLLFLLSSPPRPLERAALHAAFHEPLTSVLAQVSSQSSGLGPAPILTIALAAPFLPIRWESAQSLLAGLYSLVASTGTDVDVRIVLVDHVQGRTYPPDRIAPPNDSIVLELGDFASSAHKPAPRWERIFHASTEAGYELLTAFLTCAERSQTLLQRQIVAVPGGLSLSKASEVTARPLDANSASKRFNTVCLGGTFDHIHAGHKLLLHASALRLALPRNRDASSPATLIIGVTGNELLKNKKYAEELESWSSRTRSVLSFLSTVFSEPLADDLPLDAPIGSDEEIRALFFNGSLAVRCVNISDPFGPPIHEEACDAIVLSAETRGGGTAINDRRAERGWKPLEVFEIDILNTFNEDGEVVEVVDPADFSAKISSTEIRKRRAEARAKGAQQNGEQVA